MNILKLFIPNFFSINDFNQAMKRNGRFDNSEGILLKQNVVFFQFPLMKVELQLEHIFPVLTKNFSSTQIQKQTNRSDNFHGVVKTSLKQLR